MYDETGYREKTGKKAVFTVDTIIADEVLSTKEVNVQVDTVEVKGKNSI